MANSGTPYRKIYDDVFQPVHGGMGFETFRHKIQAWRKKQFIDDKTLETANLNWDFTPYAATVQVNGSGDITQAWVKQSASGKAYSDLIAEIRQDTQPVHIDHSTAESSHMLEIPLYDMHFGIANIDLYIQTLNETAETINLRHWKKVLFVIGQDLFHNDDFRGRTSSGRPIQQIDLAKAWRDARLFYLVLIDAAIAQSDNVEIIYNKGNHDESMAWAFVQMLKERYPDAIVDDSFKARKARTFGKCFIGFTHGNAKKSSPRDLRGQFTIAFPVEFAQSTVREIHSGHLHTEMDADEYGIMCRRLCSGNGTDEWSDNEGFVGSHKRFMLFEWSEDKLASIHYV